MFMLSAASPFFISSAILNSGLASNGITSILFPRSFPNAIRDLPAFGIPKTISLLEESPSSASVFIKSASERFVSSSIRWKSSIITVPRGKWLGNSRMSSRSARLRADKLSTRSSRPASAMALEMEVVLPMPDGPSITTLRPAVRNATMRRLYSTGWTNVISGTPDCLNTSCTSTMVVAVVTSASRLGGFPSKAPYLTIPATGTTFRLPSQVGASQS